MQIYNGGTVVIWSDKSSGRAFNDIKKADKYFAGKKSKKENPQWQRIVREPNYFTGKGK